MGNRNSTHLAVVLVDFDYYIDIDLSQRLDETKIAHNWLLEYHIFCRLDCFFTFIEVTQ